MQIYEAFQVKFDEQLSSQFKELPKHSFSYRTDVHNGYAPYQWIPYNFRNQTLL